MVLDKSLDVDNLIAAVLHDVFETHGDVFDIASRKNTLNKVRNRVALEGIGFLTKTLPRLGKALDRALSSDTALDSISLGFKPYKDSKFPKLFGELFKRVLGQDGRLLPLPCAKCVKSLRQILYLFYKYELPYSDEQEQQVLDKFVRTEQELEAVSAKLDELKHLVDNTMPTARLSKEDMPVDVVRKARRALSDLFAFFDPKDIIPRHGPGAVATRQQLQEKYEWSNISAKITRTYEAETYFYASLSHFGDRLQEHQALSSKDLPARVVLVPKDSRGPRLISCEPVDYQWIQQGLGRAIVSLVENNVLTKYSVFFTDQVPNQHGALLGSMTGGYATLDLNEASDRVTLSLVRLLFPPHIYDVLANCRSSSTVLPDGMIIPLWKFAPMGSALCFPILALTIWAILYGVSHNAEYGIGWYKFGKNRKRIVKDRIHVYGDDVIVPTAQAEDAIKWLEYFGLKINQDKSCSKGFFRESCGVDAFKGVSVTPVRLRTVWTSSRSPDSYTSWIAYANSFWERGYLHTYDYIVRHLSLLYGPIPTKDRVENTVPSLCGVSKHIVKPHSRYNVDLQKTERLCWVTTNKSVRVRTDGWNKLFRFFIEAASKRTVSPSDQELLSQVLHPESFSVSSYTRRNTSMLVKRWR